MNGPYETAAVRPIDVDGQSFIIHPLDQIPDALRLPISLRILLENVLRRLGHTPAGDAMARRIVRAGHAGKPGEEIDFARVPYQAASLDAEKEQPIVPMAWKK